MKKQFAAFATFFLLVVAPSAAYATVPAVTVETYCAVSGAAAVRWTVTVYPSSNGASHNDVRVEISVDDGPWTQVGTGALTPANNFTFTSGIELPDGSLSLRARTRAVGAWSNGLINERYEYAVLTLNEFQATDYAVPTNCAPPPPSNPGTGTPGFWKNHPEAWPVSTITIGGTVYTRDQAIAILSTPTAKDVTYTMARHLISAELNGIIGNDVSCIEVILDDAQAWMTAHPVGSKVAGKDASWVAGAAIASELDAYNNGELCAPHRD